MKLITHLCLGSRLRMCRAIPVLCLYAFMAWTGTTLPYLFITIQVFMGTEHILSALSVFRLAVPWFSVWFVLSIRVYVLQEIRRSSSCMPK
jgi:hypothetical protein